MIRRGGERYTRFQRDEAGRDDEIVASPDGIRFAKGCMIAIPLSSFLWWLILQVASAMI